MATCIIFFLFHNYAWRTFFSSLLNCLRKRGKNSWCWWCFFFVVVDPGGMMWFFFPRHNHQSLFDLNSSKIDDDLKLIRWILNVFFWIVLVAGHESIIFWEFFPFSIRNLNWKSWKLRTIFVVIWRENQIRTFVRVCAILIQIASILSILILKF